MQVHCVALTMSTLTPLFSMSLLSPKATLPTIMAISQRNSDYDDKLFNLFDGTPYGNYMYKDTYRTAKGFKRAKTPPNASLYCQLYIKGHALKISAENALFYVSGKVDNTRRIFCDILPHKYPHEQQLVKRYRKYFNGLIEAIADNRIYYDNAVTNECFQDFYKWLSI